MSLAISGDTVAYLMTLGLTPEQMKGLIDRLQRDAMAMSPPSSSSGINEERERIRNESTYAERKRAKDRARRQAERDELRRLRELGSEASATTPASSGDYSGEALFTEEDAPATTGDAPLPLPPSPRTPQPPTPARESVSSTRESRAREEAAWGRFWLAYPRKVSKADARRAFTKAWSKLPPLDEEDILLGGLERAKAAWVDAQFIPHAATWLNGERWTDEPTVIPLQPRQAHERPHSDAKFAAKQANLAAHERGADLAARLYREP